MSVESEKLCTNLKWVEQRAVRAIDTLALDVTNTQKIEALIESAWVIIYIAEAVNMIRVYDSAS